MRGQSAHWIEAFKKNGTILIGTATNIKEAIALEKAGVHAICVQGAEAGGHCGTFIDDYRQSMIGLKSLIPQVVDVVSLPVIAAGGIMNGSGIAAIIALGASGVQMGTVFLTMRENLNAELLPFPYHNALTKPFRTYDCQSTWCYCIH